MATRRLRKPRWNKWQKGKLQDYLSGPSLPEPGTPSPTREGIISVRQIPKAPAFTPGPAATLTPGAAPAMPVLSEKQRQAMTSLDKQRQLKGLKARYLKRGPRREREYPAEYLAGVEMLHRPDLPYEEALKTYGGPSAQEAAAEAGLKAATAGLKAHELERAPMESEQRDFERDIRLGREEEEYQRQVRTGEVQYRMLERQFETEGRQEDLQYEIDKKMLEGELSDREMAQIKIYDDNLSRLNDKANSYLEQNDVESFDAISSQMQDIMEAQSAILGLTKAEAALGGAAPPISPAKPLSKRQAFRKRMFEGGIAAKSIEEGGLSPYVAGESPALAGLESPFRKESRTVLTSFLQALKNALDTAPSAEERLLIAQSIKANPAYVKIAEWVDADKPWAEEQWGSVGGAAKQAAGLVTGPIGMAISTSGKLEAKKVAALVRQIVELIEGQ